MRMYFLTQTWCLRNTNNHISCYSNCYFILTSCAPITATFYLVISCSKSYISCIIPLTRISRLNLLAKGLCVSEAGWRCLYEAEQTSRLATDNCGLYRLLSGSTSNLCWFNAGPESQTGCSWRRD